MSQEDKESFFPTLVNVQGQEKPETAEDDEKKQAELLKEDDNDISEELRMLLQQFNSHDKKQIGMIPDVNVKEILVTLNYPTEDLDDVIKYAMMTKEGFITFDELLAIISEMQLNSEYVDEEKLFAKRQLKTDRRLIGFLKLLDEYRKKCERQGNYPQAKKSKTKIEEIKEKEGIRKRNFLRIAHVQQLNNIEQIQKKQFQEFSTNWDLYMSQYEEVALESLEKLKQRHVKQLQELTNKVRKELEPKVHFSKYVIELRTKQKNLVKLQQYQEAEKIRAKIEELEQEEIQNHQVEVNETLELKVANLKKQQVSVLNALLKRIQRDRNQQLRQRQKDSQTLIVKNRNIRNDLTHKHQQEIKKAVQSLRQFMSLNFEQGKTEKKEERKEDKRGNTERRTVGLSSRNP